MRGGGAVSLAAFAAVLGGVEGARAGDAALGEYLSTTCVTCHQKSGQTAGGVPSIVGWPADQFIAVMKAYRNKDRENEVMRSLAANLSQEDIEALAAYFEGLKPAR